MMMQPGADEFAARLQAPDDMPARRRLAHLRVRSLVGAAVILSGSGSGVASTRAELQWRKPPAGAVAHLTARLEVPPGFEPAHLTLPPLVGSRWQLQLRFAGGEPGRDLAVAGLTPVRDVVANEGDFEVRGPEPRLRLSAVEPATDARWLRVEAVVR